VSVPTFVFVHQGTDTTWRLVSDGAGRLVMTLRPDLATQMTLALAERGYAPVTTMERTPDQVADALLANGVPTDELHLRMAFVEAMGDDLASDEARVAAMAQLVPTREPDA
jgi:hypothetical protein